MRVMVLIKATEESEAGVMPSQELLRQMGNFNEELVKAGVMLAGEGLHPSAKGVRVAFSGSERKVSVLARYMAICRGRTTFAVRRDDKRSARLTLYCRATTR